MTIEFQCSSCNTTLRVPKEHLGKQARCPQCSNLNLVEPGSPPAGYAPNVANQISPESGHQPHIPYSAGRESVLHAQGTTPQPSYHYSRPHRGGLVLALGIISICCSGVVVPGILAWIFGRNDLKAMDAGLMDPEGRGMTQAGMIMGMVMTIFAIIGLVFMICYFLFIFLFVVGMAGAGM